MLASELSSFGSRLSASPLSEDRFWSRPLEQVSPAEIQLFYARAGRVGQIREARELVDQLQSALVVGAMEGRVSGSALRIIAHEVPQEPMMVEELVEKLLRLSVPRRQAAVFALAAHIEPTRVVALEWHVAKGMAQLCELAINVLNARLQLRHLRLPYVFWEFASEKVASPLIELREDVEQAFDMKWPSIQMAWNDMAWFSGKAETASFMSLISEVQAGKL